MRRRHERIARLAHGYGHLKHMAEARLAACRREQRQLECERDELLGCFEGGRLAGLFVSQLDQRLKAVSVQQQRLAAREIELGRRLIAVARRLKGLERLASNLSEALTFESDRAELEAVTETALSAQPASFPQAAGRRMSANQIAED